jgi:hypothetical protein
VTGFTVTAASRIAFWKSANEPNCSASPHSTIHTSSGPPLATRSNGFTMPSVATVGPWSTNSAVRHE